MTRVYLETSFFSACVSRRTTAKSLGWRASSLDWGDTQRARHELFISPEVVRELSAEDFAERDSALGMLSGLRLLELTREVEQVGELLVNEKVMPLPALSGDAIHVAAAPVHRMDYILTWNVQHLAEPQQAHAFWRDLYAVGLGSAYDCNAGYASGA